MHSLYYLESELEFKSKSKFKLFYRVINAELLAVVVGATYYMR